MNLHVIDKYFQKYGCILVPGNFVWTGGICGHVRFLVVPEADGKDGKFMHFNGIQWILIAGSNGLKMRCGESFLEHLDMVRTDRS